MRDYFNWPMTRILNIIKAVLLRLMIITGFRLSVPSKASADLRADRFGFAPKARLADWRFGTRVRHTRIRGVAIGGISTYPDRC